MQFWFFLTRFKSKIWKDKIVSRLFNHISQKKLKFIRKDFIYGTPKKVKFTISDTQWKKFKLSNKQGNITPNEGKCQLIETDIEIIQIVIIADKYAKIIIVTVSHMFEKKWNV